MKPNSLSIILQKDVTSVDTHFDNNVVFGSKLGRTLVTIPIIGAYCITQETALKPSAVSKAVYGTEEYDWVLLMVNGVTSKELTVGKLLYIPPVDSISNYLSK